MLKNHSGAKNRCPIQLGLPDLSWSKHTKTGKYSKRSQTIPKGHKLCIPNGRKIFQMTIKYNNILHSKAITNFSQIWDFGFENIPSGNPDLKKKRLTG
jgi:hypothetical protein